MAGLYRLNNLSVKLIVLPLPLKGVTGYAELSVDENTDLSSEAKRNFERRSDLE